MTCYIPAPSENRRRYEYHQVGCRALFCPMLEQFPYQRYIGKDPDPLDRGDGIFFHEAADYKRLAVFDYDFGANRTL